MFFNAEFSSPWCARSVNGCDVTSYLSPKSQHVIIFHLVTEGHGYARIEEEDERPLSLEAGEILFVPHGDGLLLGNGPSVTPVDRSQVIKQVLSQGLKVSRMGGGGEVTKFICGYMSCDPQLGRVFLAGLPPILKVRIRDDAPSLHRAAPQEQTGWLAGVRDPEVGQALALLHRKPADPWTVASLSKAVGISRSVLAERWRRYLTETPYGLSHTLASATGCTNAHIYKQ